MSVFKKFMSAVSSIILVIGLVVALSTQAEAKKFDKSCLPPGKAAKARRHFSFLEGNPDQPVIVGAIRSRRSYVRVAAGDINGDGKPDAVRKRVYGKLHILPYIEQDNLYK
jgi:hypothetical protein